ncbi:MAG: hypothetical protein EOP04_32215, partial [Proteobacteria bacterium]
MTAYYYIGPINVAPDSDVVVTPDPVAALVADIGLDRTELGSGSDPKAVTCGEVKFYSPQKRTLTLETYSSKEVLLTVSKEKEI